MSEITQSETNKFREAFLANPAQRVGQRSVWKNGINNSAQNQSTFVENTPTFSIDLNTGKVANQKKSGRCWMFAALNTMRHKLSSDFNLANFELSQNYTFFWDKYEKANYFYENILATADLDRTSREVSFLLQTPQQDGGQWDMMVSIFDKYGIVPKSAMPETASSSDSTQLNEYLNKLLRKHALILRTLVAEHASANEIEAKRQDLLQEVYNVLAMALGIPPETFDFEYRDENNNFLQDRELTPQSFFKKYIDIDFNDYISVINAPTDDKPFMHTYSVDMLGNVVNGKPVQYLNLEMDDLKALALKQLQAGESVWFGSDVGQSSIRDKGIMALDAYDVNELFDVDFDTTKAQRLDYGESMMTHAMVLTGVDLVNDQPTKWKVENSWGDKVGTNGFFVMSDAWMDEFTYQIVVRKDLLTDDQKAALETEPIKLAPWDPMGALA
ncbi:aminopeptidase [Weissella viridescens]|uniref:Aminopeptidase n=1 Tax=Weissella viridescens TaxID=1629 RepID=A0A3P2RHT6_WEIVI|nr:C1 family peptidase [Weissella viridescens]RRG18310.1 aminopeptidase [Weissella viridescens]